MTDRETREAVHALLNVLDAQDAAEEVQRAENALGWTLAASDADGGHETLHGLFSDPVEALRVAERWQDDLNRGIGTDQPFVVKTRLVRRWENWDPVRRSR